MFSRGNITEKIRFGKLVQKGEIVLDLYGGIGYFSLPALVRGQAEYLYACEWNPNAVEALLFNLKDNQVDERATVYMGDCRVVAKENNLVNMFDRVSLGLLPSSEGGWRTAVRAVRNATGGWLHVHANVPVKELDIWALWLCCCLRDFVREEEKPDSWVVLCAHVEKVKSFAPTVNHYVADVFVGPAGRLPFDVDLKPGDAAVLRDDQRAEHCPASVTPPSCALSPDGVLHQSWMRE
jgi:tRNA G37 N-methylase Trm5